MGMVLTLESLPSMQKYSSIKALMLSAWTSRDLGTVRASADTSEIAMNSMKKATNSLPRPDSTIKIYIKQSLNSSLWDTVKVVL